METEKFSKVAKMSNEQQKVSELSVANLKAIIKECNEEVLGSIAKLSEDVKELKSQNEALVHEMELLKEENNLLKRRLNDLESQIKGKNLVFRGIAAGQANKIEIQKLCSTVLQVEKTVKSVKTLYQKERMTAVLVEFESENDVEDVISKTRNLRGTNIYVERDLNAERRRDKIIMLQLRKQLMEFSKAHQIKIRDDKLRVGSKWFKWNKDRKLVCGTIDAITVMKELFGDNFNLNIKYNILKKNWESKN